MNDHHDEQEVSVYIGTLGAIGRVAGIAFAAGLILGAGLGWLVSVLARC